MIFSIGNLNIAFSAGGIDFKFKNSSWYGIHFYWQSIPFFDLIYSHNRYGFIVFGLWIYIKIEK